MKLPLHLPSPPRALIFTLLLLGVGSIVPLTLFLMHSTSYHEQPRIHLFQDMDNQVKKKAQSATPLFADGRAMRPAVPGAVARGRLGEDDHLNRGFELVQASNDAGEPGARADEPEARTDEPEARTEYLSGFPESITVERLFVEHGKERYEAMCSLCHGLDGRGVGPVHQRSQQLMTSGRGLGTRWVQPASLLAVTDGGLTYGRELYPEGELYNTIANGKGNMTGYAHAIPVDDRWAIVAYIRALQDAQEAEVLAEAAAAARAPEEAEAEKTEEIPEPIANPGVPMGDGAQSAEDVAPLGEMGAPTDGRAVEGDDGEPSKSR